MLSLIDVIYLVFAGISIFFGVLFFVLHFKQKTLEPVDRTLSYFPTVSIIIPAFNEESNIRDTLTNLKKMDYPKDKLEIVVVNDGSTDKTSEIAKSEGVTVLEKENQGNKAFALNRGLKHVTGEIVGCMDADSYPNTGALKQAIGFFDDDRVAAVTTSIFAKQPKKLIERIQAIEYILIIWSRKLLEILDGVYVTPGPLSLYKGDVLKKVGGFDEKNLTEDIEIAWKLMFNGYIVKMSNETEVLTSVPKNFKTWWKQRVRWNVGGFQTTKKYLGVMFKSGYGSLGTFVLPFFYISYTLSMIGFSLFTYLIVTSLYNMIYYSMLAINSGGSPVYTKVFDFMFLPSIFSIFGVLMLLISLVWIKMSFKSTGKNPIIGLYSIVDMIIYLTFYITVFPILTMYSIVLWITKKYTW